MHAGRFAAMVGAFCARLGWTDLEALVTKFQQRVFYGVRPEVRQPRLCPGVCVGGGKGGAFQCLASLIVSKLYPCCSIMGGWVHVYVVCLCDCVKLRMHTHKA